MDGQTGIPSRRLCAGDRTTPREMATVKQRGKTWQLQWSDATGHHRVSLGKIGKTEADIKRREKELELKTGRLYRTTGVAFTSFALDYLEWYAVQWPSSYTRVKIIVEQQLEPEFGPRDIDSIAPLDVTKFIGRRSTEVKQGTVTKEVRCLLAMLNRAKEWRMIREHGLEFYSAPQERSDKPPTFYTALELKRLYWASYGHEWTWKLFANTGLRRNEALQLKLPEVKADALIIHSLESAPTKSRKWREVPLNDAAIAAIEALKEYGAKPYLLPRITPPSLTRAFAACANRVALPGSLHSLRHTFVSHLVMAGVDLPTVQKLAGHASITTTMRYAHLAPRHKQLAVQKIAL
jgi:integrase